MSDANCKTCPGFVRGESSIGNCVHRERRVKDSWLCPLHPDFDDEDDTIGFGGDDLEDEE